MRHIIDGIRYNIEEYGEGYPTILLHGFTGSSAMWKPFFERWGKHASLLAIDIIGHGKTEPSNISERYKMLSVVDDLFLIMEKLKIQKADFVGYSMGGRLALSFAAKYPSKVRKLVLESSSPGLETDSQRQQRVDSDEKLANFIIENGIEAFVEYWGNIPLFNTMKSLPIEEREQLNRDRLNNTVVGLTYSLKGMGTGAQPSWWEELKVLKTETLILTGTLDTKFCAIANRMHKQLQNSTWECVEGCGHAIHVENREKFGTIVEEFLSHTYMN